tara:strand:- start:11997 stop:12287 length:291 start_codon:yes stop_codon:yes gene_type:complete
MKYELNKRERNALELESEKVQLEELVSKVLSRVSWSDRAKIDKLLFYDHTLHGHLDCTNLKKDKKAVISKSRIIYRGIKKIDTNLGNVFLRHQDDV